MKRWDRGRAQGGKTDRLVASTENMGKNRMTKKERQKQSDREMLEGGDGELER